MARMSSVLPRLGPGPSVWRGWILGLAVAAAPSVLGCDCEGNTVRRGPCADPSPPEGCGQVCTPSMPCPPGLFCNAGTCSAECAEGTDHRCSAGRTCSAQGRCVLGGADAGTMAEDASFVPADSNLGDVPAPDNTCASVTLDATRVIPNVLLVVDRSGSMESNRFGAVTRWQALDGALFDPASGLVTGLESSVRFGIAMYSNDSRTMACPDLFTVPCALNNAEAIEAEYTLRTPPRGDTPTGESISAVVGMVDALVPDRSDASPTFFVLATDGEPDLCADGSALEEGRAASVAAVNEAFGLGINTYVVSVGAEVSATHLQDVANAGAGRSGAPFYVATDTAGLVDALRTIIRGVASCDVRLEGMVVPALACDGTVRLGAEALRCGTDWMLLDDGRTIRLIGPACERLQGSGETLTASFPCEAILE
jgi:Mg-chelatase subunit ChlD